MNFEKFYIQSTLITNMKKCFFFQVVIVGNGAVGKSSMIQRYCKGTFTKDYKKTIGVDFLERVIEWVKIIFINLLYLALSLFLVFY